MPRCWRRWPERDATGLAFFMTAALLQVAGGEVASMLLTFLLLVLLADALSRVLRGRLA